MACESSCAKSTLLLTTVYVFLLGTATAQLSSNFYASTCPNVLSIIKQAVDSAVSKEARMGASLLRLHFHDCFVNASTLFSLSLSLCVSDMVILRHSR